MEGIMHLWYYINKNSDINVDLKQYKIININILMICKHMGIQYSAHLLLSFK
jgi:hypothetical protein